MELVSSSRAVSSNVFRGWWEFGKMRSISISFRWSDSRSGVPKRALSPLPNAFLCAMDDLLCKSDITLGSFRLNVVEQNRPTMARRLTQPNIARNYGRKQLITKEFP